MDFWNIGRAKSVHKDHLVALVHDIHNWRTGEIARVTIIEPEGAGIIRLGLQFHDAHEHVERTHSRFSLYGAGPIGVYYRYSEASEDNFGGRTMIDDRVALPDLVADCLTLKRMNPHVEKVQHLSFELLALQYRFIFSEEFPLLRGANGNNHNGHA